MNVVEEDGDDDEEDPLSGPYGRLEKPSMWNLVELERCHCTALNEMQDGKQNNRNKRPIQLLKEIRPQASASKVFPASAFHTGRSKLVA